MSNQEIEAQRAIRSGRLCDPSDDVVAVPVTDAQAKALKLQADCAGIATLEPTQARHVAGQAVMINKKLQMMLALAVQVDERGLDAGINCLTFHLRYPKEKA